MIRHTRYDDIEAFTTKDGSRIRELMHPAHHGAREQSLAEAEVSPGSKTSLHRHLRTEEIYHVIAGQGKMTLGEQTFTVAAGDTVCIPPGTAHCIENIGNQTLRILCACTPAYSHQDTELLE